MTDGGFQNYLHMVYGLPNGFISSTPPVDTVVYDGDYVDKHFYKQYLKKKQKEQELLESTQIFPAKIKKAPPILDDDEAELMMIFAELFDD